MACPCASNPPSRCPHQIDLLHVSERDRVLVWHVSDAAESQAAIALANEIVDACTALDERLDPLVAVVVDASPPNFCLKPPGSADDLDFMQPSWAAATAAVARLTTPTVAVLRGDAIGPAWELALACDLRIASSAIRVGSPELRWGRIPASGGTQRLMRIGGIPTALRLLLLSELVTGETAYALRLVHRVAAPNRIDREVDEWLGHLRASAPIALAYAKEAVHQALHLSLQDGMRLEADLAVLLQTTGDRAEGLSGFIERREPRFEGQ